MTSATTLLVPLDGSLHAIAALPVARALAELRDATLAVLHVADVALGSAALVDLNQWERFEAANPRAFITSYLFYVQSAADPIDGTANRNSERPLSP